MKKIFLAFTLLFVTVGFAQAQIGGPEIEFEKEVHDFGTLEYGGNATTEFVFTNTGSAPLIISNAKGSCGCTVPSWPKTPVAPGQSASIKVKYDSKRPGPINKSVTITSNADNAGTKVVRIKGKIQQKPSESTTPVNQNNSLAPKNN